MDEEFESPRRFTRAQNKARTREALLLAAAEVFSEKGFAGASVEGIASRAGYSTGAVYSNFSGKDELFVELLTTRSTRRLAESTAELTRCGSTLEQARAAIDRLLAESLTEDEGFAALEAEFWLYAIRRPALRVRLAARFCAHRDALAAALQARARLRDQFVEVRYDDVATVLLALFLGLLQLRRTGPGLAQSDLYSVAAQWILTGINPTHGETHD